MSEWEMENENPWKDVFVFFSNLPIVQIQPNRLFLVFLNSLLQFASVDFCLESSCRELKLPASDFQILSLHILKSVTVILESCSLRVPPELLWTPSKGITLPWLLLSCSVLVLQNFKQIRIMVPCQTQRKALHLSQVFRAPGSHYLL